MPDSPLELGSTEERLRSFLVENFPASQAVLSSAADAPYPLLLLHLQHELAGFALSNGDPRRSFEQSYSFFKQLYADRHREWDELNLTFVLCLAHRDRELEAFCARIETDVYFCRKFAVALDAKWEIELARLPFFPLERRVGGFRRPPSAQTLLKSYGVLAPLAASIVGRVSEESIVEACLSGRVGDPKLVVSDTLDAQIATDDATQTIRLQRVEIENFRAYRRPQSFDFDADVIVLYGPNGFGKTSFFDAVDFAATGDIGRLQVGKHEPRFTKAARHLDAAAESDSVTLSVRAQDGIHEIRRTVEHRNSPSLDGTTVSRKQALLALTGPHVSPGADHVEHLVRLFRATHLFSQEFQTLTENFREHCRLSADDVSRMLAFEDYVTAGRKVGKVLEFIGRSVGAGDLRVAELTDALTKDRAELARFHESARSAESPQAVAALRENLRVKLAAAGVDRWRIAIPWLKRAAGGPFWRLALATCARWRLVCQSCPRKLRLSPHSARNF
jgi:exonuclease SbcC